MPAAISRAVWISRRVEGLEQVAVAEVVGDHQHEAGCGLQFLTGGFQRQNATIVRQRMQDHGDVLARLYYLVQIADGALAYRTGQGAVLPEGAVGTDQ